MTDIKEEGVTENKSSKSFPVIKVVIIATVIAILVAIAIPITMAIIKKSKEKTLYDKATKVRDEILDSEDIEALTDMKGYLFCVDDKVYEVSDNGNLVLKEFDIKTSEEDGDIIQVERHDGDGVVVYVPNELTAYGRAIKARNKYRKDNNMSKNYYEMEHYIITVFDEEINKDINYQVQYSSNQNMSGSLILIDDTIETLNQKGLEYEMCQGYNADDTWNGVVYAPTEQTKLEYRILSVEKEATEIVVADENKKSTGLKYVVDGKLYKVEDEQVLPCRVEGNKSFTRILPINQNQATNLTLEELINEGYLKFHTSELSEELLATITEVNRNIDAYKKIETYTIQYGYYDTTDTYHSWLDYEALNGGRVTKLVYNENASVADIKKLIVSDVVTGLGHGAFANYTSLEEIILPETLTEIDANPFANGCINTIKINDECLGYTDYNDTAIVKLGTEKVLIAGTNGLLDDNSKMPVEIVEIGNYAFENSNINIIDIVGLNKIGNGVFKNCSGLMSVAHDMENIPTETFSGCEFLQFVSGSQQLKVIGVRAFEGCKLLSELDVPETLTAINQFAFDGCVNNGYGFTLNYASSKKIFTNKVIVEADLSHIFIEYALKDITYELNGGVEVKENPLLLNPKSNEELKLNSPDKGYKYVFVDWSVRGTESENDYANIKSNGTLENPYVLVQSTYVEDITLTANYKQVMYNINYVVDGIDVTASEELIGYPKEYNSLSLANVILPKLNRKGYTFDGWYLCENKIEEVFVPTGKEGDITVHSVFSLNTYTISYELNGGTLVEPNPTEFTVLSNTFTLKNPTKEGYNFIGWIGSNGTEPEFEITIEKGSIKDRNYEAVYKVMVYNITYDLCFGVLANPNESKYTINTPNIILNRPTRAGYTFNGWSDGVNNIGDTFVCLSYKSDVTLKALWQANEYNIIYVGDHIQDFNNVTKFTYSDGNELPLIEINLNDPLTSNGYTFSKWTGGCVVDDVIYNPQPRDITVVANVKATKYNIIYNLNGGIMEGEYPTTYTIETETFTVNKKPTRVGYNFTGWKETGSYYSNEAITIQKGSTGDKEFTANWSLIYYTITYSKNVYGNPTSYHIETETFTLKNPTKRGYDFAGWTGSNGDVPQTTVTIEKGSFGDRTYSDNWTPIVYSLTYNLNGGSLEVENPTSYTIETETFTLNNPTKTGYTFSGWIEAGGYSSSQTVTIEKGSIGNKEYTAYWNIIYYTITYSTQVYGNPTSYTIKTETFTLKNPTKRGYIFEGWTGSNGDVPQTTVTIEKGSIGDKTYIDNWSIITYTITYNLDGGSLEVENPTSYTVETETFTLNNPTRIGYEFTGWLEDSCWTYQKEEIMTIEKGTTGDLNYTAYWSYIHYNITYSIDVYGNRSSYCIDTETFTLNNPSRTGYIFEGWTGSNGDVPQTTVTIEKGSIGDKTYTDNWSIITYTLSYILDGGVVEPENPTSYTVETETFTLNNPIKLGYSFAGWAETGWSYLTHPTVTIEKGTIGNKEFTACWNLSLYNVTLDQRGGTGGTTSVQAKYNEPMPEATKPTKMGYTFDGYYTEIDGNGDQYYTAEMTSTVIFKLTTHLNLYAKWIANQYTVTLQTNQWVLVNGTTSVVATFGEPMPEAIAPIVRGHSFGGYYTGENGTGTQYYTEDMISARNYDIAEDTILYSKCTPNQYSIIFDQQGGTDGTTSVQINYGDPFPEGLVAPTREGYIFRGYNTEMYGVGALIYYDTMQSTGGLVYDIDGDMTLYAMWENGWYQIELDLQGGTIKGDYGTIYTEYIGVSYDFEMPTGNIGPRIPTKNGYTFGGYYTEPDGNGTQYYDEEMQSEKIYDIPHDTTFYAKWVGKEYTVTLDQYGGTGGTTSVTVNFGEPMPEAKAPKRNGYAFGGYYTYQSDSVGSAGRYYYNAQMESITNWDVPEENITLRARWIYKTLIVYFNYNVDGSNAKICQYFYATDEGKNRFGYYTNGNPMSEQTKQFCHWDLEGYKLLGWSESPNATSATYSVYSKVTNSWIDKHVADTDPYLENTINLYCVWAKKSLTVVFNKNDGLNSTVSQTFTYGVSGNRFGYNTNGTPKWGTNGQFGQWTRSGYKLLGWSTNAKAVSPTYSIYAKVTDNWIDSNTLDSKGSGTVKLYCVWKKISSSNNNSNVNNGGGSVGGSFKTSVASAYSDYPASATVKWERISYTSTSTTIRITVTANAGTKGHGWQRFGTRYVTVNGVKVSGCNYDGKNASQRINAYNGTVVMSGTYTIKHTGPITLNIYCAISVNKWDSINSTGRGTWIIGS